MKDEYVKTLVMDITSETPAKPSAAQIAEKIQATIDENNEVSLEVTFTQTYSYLT